MVFAEPLSDALREGLELLARGDAGEAEAVVKAAALAAKAEYGSGSHPLARAYADLGRLHLRTGEFQKAAVEFQHASKGAMPADAAGRADRLGFMYGFAAAVVGLGKFEEAEKVLRQCATFARSLYGPMSARAVAAGGPLADALLKAGKPADALQAAQDAYDALWRLGDPLIAGVIPVRAEALKAAGRSDNPFTDLADLPDAMVSEAVAGVIARAPTSAPAHARAMLADLLAFADKKYGDGHAVTSDVLAAVAHHEGRQGDRADATVRRTAVRRAVWSYAVRRMPGGLLANLEIGFEPDGTIHLVPHLARDPREGEAAELEAVLTDAVDDLYARPAAGA